ncbi:hypothetical protein BDQ12DRAFT_683717 [Crucibulum laeve]|uniref:Uncharacterized protein n=1 Tax=Crucibulum laeve TaxID=68775 RepID=A0A5C3M2T6_9AGAR|nr:hypothetical protein BDQ12DRAFT_683717 [Crucibulum laeve]
MPACQGTTDHVLTAHSIPSITVLILTPFVFHVSILNLQCPFPYFFDWGVSHWLPSAQKNRGLQLKEC